MSRVLLGVNIDHIATLRQARGTRYPEPVQAALVAEQAGADGITVHLREDRRHINDRDVELLAQTLQTGRWSLWTRCRWSTYSSNCRKVGFSSGAAAHAQTRQENSSSCWDLPLPSPLLECIRTLCRWRKLMLSNLVLFSLDSK